VFDITILVQYCWYWGQEPVELDRDAIKQYLTTDESWAQHRWMAIRRKLQFPFSISFHDGPYSRTEEIVGNVNVDAEIDEEDLMGKMSCKDEDETRALLGRSASTRNYGTQ
jgi:hypothetical protein